MADFPPISKDNIPTQTGPVIIKSVPVTEILRTYNIIPLPTKPPEKNPYEGKLQSFTRDPQLYLSPLGTPVMQDITFKSVTYTDFTTGKQRITPDIKMIDILMNITQPFKVVTTEIQGRNGTVKEYIGKDDFNITINGIIVGDNGNHPADKIITLNNTMNARVAIPVVNTYMNNLGIFNIVITEFTLEQEPGGYSKQNFTVQALSDVDVILQIL